jgi:hypothetical protein
LNFRRNDHLDSQRSQSVTYYSFLTSGEFHCLRAFSSSPLKAFLKCGRRLNWTQGLKKGRTVLSKSCRRALEPKKNSRRPHAGPCAAGSYWEHRQHAATRYRHPGPACKRARPTVSLFYNDATAVGLRFHCAAGSRGAARSPIAMRRRLRRHECASVKLLLPPLKAPSLLPAA